MDAGLLAGGFLKLDIIIDCIDLSFNVFDRLGAAWEGFVIKQLLVIPPAELSYRLHQREQVLQQRG